MSTTPRPSFEGSQLEGSGIPQLLPWAPMDPHQEVEDYGWRQPKYDPRMSDIEPDNLMLDHLSSSTKWGRMLSIGHGHVLMLARFADQRQTQVSDHWKPTKDGVGRPEMVPNPNGSQYLENYVVLESTFQDYRSWFQYIHYRHLVKLRRIHAHGRVMEFDTTRLEQFMYDLEIWYTYLNEDETARVQQKPGYLPAGAPSSNCVYLLRPGCEWIQDLSNSIGEGFAAIWAAHIWADLHGKEVAPHLEMVSIANGSRAWKPTRSPKRRPFGLHAKLIPRQAFETLPMVTRVLLYCFDRQHAFEHGLSHSHADDILLHKRINILSNADMATIGPQNAENAVATFFDPLKARIMDYQTKMLTQYHYRLLRDWGYGRPWEKLMLIVDPGDFPRSSPEEVDTGVKQLQQFITQSPKFVSQLFDVLPLLPSNIEDDPGDCLTCTTATVQPGRLFAR